MRMQSVLPGAAAHAAALPPAPSPAPREPGDRLGISRMMELIDESGRSPDTQWRFRAGGWMYEPAVGADGTVYAGCGDHNLYALNPDGSVKWRYDTGGLVPKAPVAGSDGTVYASSDRGALIALNADGTKKWVNNGAGYGAGAPSIGPDETLCSGSGRGLHAVTPRGKTKWLVDTGFAMPARPVFDRRGNIFIADRRGDLRSFDAKGAVRWEVRLHQPLCAPAAIGVDGSLLITRVDALDALDPDTGAVRWSIPANPASEAGPAVAEDGTIYVACHDGVMMARNADGSEKWTSSAQASLATTPLIGEDGTIVVRDACAGVWAFTKDGALAWTQEMPSTAGGMLSRPAVGADGTVFVGSDDGSLTALHWRPLQERIREEASQPQENHEDNRIEADGEWIIVGGVKLPLRR